MNNISKSHICVVVTAIFTFMSFLVLDSFSISTGDDLGYMFTDSQLHNGDGHQITTPSECLSTQINHYRTTNGRFIVHLLTSFFVSICNIHIFHIINALVFTLLWYGIFQLTKHPGRSIRQNCGRASLILLLLWLMIPRPGVTMLSLIAYAINYLWTGAFVIIYLILLKKSIATYNVTAQSFIAAFIVSLIIGSLQESYSIPICVALLTTYLLKRGKVNRLTLIMTMGFFVGTAICCLAPGNFNHIEQGGGFTATSILRKGNALLGEIEISSISFTFLISLIFLIFNPKRFTQFINENCFYYIAIAVSLALAILTFTSIRQLFAPSIFCCIITARMIQAATSQKLLTSKFIPATCLIVLVLIFSGAYGIRQNTYAIYSDFMNRLSNTNSKTICIYASDANYNHPEIYFVILQRFDCDPLAGKDLKLLFDGYTKRGLSRIMATAGRTRPVSSIFPAPLSRIKDISQQARQKKNIILPARLDNAYSCFAVSKLQTQTPCATDETHRRIPYERFSSGDSTYYVIARADSIKI